MINTNKAASFSDLLGKTITKIGGMEKDADSIDFYCSDGSLYKLFHTQDCCEDVDIEDVAGDPNDLLNSPILDAREETSSNNPSGVTIEYQDSFTWTFYILSTIKGSVTVRWYGSSNGYYSESMDFERVK